jgi:hypothetical protein
LQLFHDLLAGIIGDLGGKDMLSLGQMQIAKRCAMLSAAARSWNEQFPYCSPRPALCMISKNKRLAGPPEEAPLGRP